MPEILLEFPRQWFEFADPADETQLIRIDLTWLTSRWTCIFGRGCPGVYKSAPEAGCCTLGAHFTDKEDRKRTEGWVAKLDETLWQNYKTGTKKGWMVKEDGEWKTRVVRKACIFHNDPDFAGGFGCALHHLADREGLSFVDVKPDVCWQVPMRRTFENIESPDETEKTVVVISEFDRGSWGPGGHDFDWYCSSNTEAHIGSEPVYISNKNEMVALIGAQAYEIAAEACRKHEQMVQQTGMNLAPHPADPQ
ncbi:unannotated protein [freshwater metagenome]|uniref:Unannotated protein n=1 Tax=freshwater metagenome TaxID=449393 RepID=A0A6J7HVG2_9ZZZZ|nr:hypothetical protein [Actinomycetota bacterium]MSY38768.1 hypothetical protein [Actinomycetota bacterium]MSZ40776.1 hypothetical protein [Actinomycetota bacterium]